MRISAQVAENLNQLSKMTGKSKQDILKKAIEAYAREQFLAKANAEYAKFKKNKKAWKEEQQELAEWDITLEDGLSDE